MALKKVSVFFALSLLLSLLLPGQRLDLFSEKLFLTLAEEVSGEIAYRYTAAISRYDRIQASEGWHDSALFIKNELEKMGYSNAAIEGWPSNGSRLYGTYKTPIGWRATEAELWLIAPKKERLCSFAEIPLTLVKHSGPAAKVEAELVDVGSGVESAVYEKVDVRGKIVLATAYTGQVMREAVIKRGALGVLTWYPPEVRPGYPNMIRYTAIWPTWEERNQVGFAFNVSKQQGWRLKQMLDSGQKITLKADVKSEFYDSEIEVLSVSLPGSEEPEKEVLIVGHLCHPAPSANDNGSGSGGMLEMARALKRLVDSGRIKSPRRTIRFLWVPEFYGTIPYAIAHLERTRQTLAAINCDMIGEDLHLTGGLFNITRTPDSMPTFLNDVVVHFANLAKRLNMYSINGSKHAFSFNVNPYSGGSDHVIFNDGSLDVPSVMFGHGDTFHHTSLDTMDKVDASELRRVCFIALASTYYMATASTAETVSLARLVSSQGIKRLTAEYTAAIHSLESSGNADSIYGLYKQLDTVISLSSEREIQSVMSVGKLLKKGEAILRPIRDNIRNIETLSAAFKRESDSVYRRRCRQLGIRAKSLTLSAVEKKMKHVIPVRKSDFIGPLQMSYVVEKLGDTVTGSIKLSGNVQYEALNFADGKRSVYDVTRALNAEFGPQNIQDVADFFAVLEKAALIDLK